MEMYALLRAVFENNIYHLKRIVIGIMIFYLLARYAFVLKETFFKEVNSTSVPSILDLDDFRLMALLALRLLCIEEQSRNLFDYLK
jgi:hypothetical protein